MNNSYTLFLKDSVQISDEEHNFFKIIKPDYVAYFSNSLIVKHINEVGVETTLEKNKDFFCTDILSTPTKKIGYEICSTILFKNNLSGKIKISYKAFGDPTKINNKELFKNISDINNVKIKWADILNKPIGHYPKKGHLHDWLDIYGLEYFEKAIDSLNTAIVNKPTLKSLNFSSKSQEIFKKYNLIKYNIKLDYKHLLNIDNPHLLNKSNVVLEKIINLKTINSYVYYNNNKQNSSLYKELLLSNEYKYITNYFLNNSLNEILLENTKFIFNKKQPLIDSLNNNNSEAILLNAEINDKKEQINFFIDQVQDVKNINNFINTEYLKYKYLYWNEEICSALMLINELGVPIDVIKELELPYFWLDFSDLNYITLDSNSKIENIIDKSIYNRIYNNTDISTRPILVNNNVTENINKAKSALFTNKCFLEKQAGEPIRLSKEITVIILTYNNSENNSFISSSNSNNYLKTKDGVFNFNNDLFNITSETTYEINNQQNFTVLCLSSLDKSYFLNNNYSGDSFDITKNNKDYFDFDIIGNKEDNNENYNFCELIIYNRVLSKIEIDLINKYFNKKYCNNYSIPLNLTFIDSVI